MSPRAMSDDEDIPDWKRKKENPKSFQAELHVVVSSSFTGAWMCISPATLHWTHHPSWEYLFFFLYWVSMTGTRGTPNPFHNLVFLPSPTPPKGSWDSNDPFRIQLSSNSPQKTVQIVRYCLKFESQTCDEKKDLNTSVENSTVIMGLEETAWGKMTLMTVGSFQVFIKIVTLICNLQVKVHVSLKTLISSFAVQTIYFSLEGRYVRRVYV